MRELDRLNRLFEASLYAMVTLPFLMIVASGSLGLPMALVFAAGLPVSWWFHRRGLARPEQARWWNAIVVVFLLAAAAQVMFTDLDALIGGIRFVLLLTLIKLFSRLSERDELQLFALSFLGLAAATTVNEEVTFGILYVVYVLVGTFALAVFHLRSELTARPRLALWSTGNSLNRAYVTVLASIGTLILGASLGIFFLFPRIGLGFFAPQDRDGVSVAGFSDKVELGGHGTIRDNPEVVMRVEYLDGPPGDTSNLRWRVMAFDHYDGRSWSRTMASRGLPLPLKDGASDLEEVHHAAAPGQRLQVYVEPFGQNILPVLRPSWTLRLGTTRLVLNWGPRAGWVRHNRYDDLTHSREDEVGVAYILTLGVGTKKIITNRSPREEFLQLPPLSDRVRRLAREMTAGAATNRQKADAIQRELQRRYTYTTNLPPAGDDPIDAFLFENRRGHCEYFATASVLLLRANGVPARLVNGFLGGEWNDVGDYLAVTQGDAHSWTEYWDPDYGWVELDATPASDEPRAARLLVVARATWDTMRLSWMKWVIEYDLNAQIEVFRDIGELLQPRGLMQSTPQERDAKAPGDWRRALLVAGLATLAFAAFRATRRRLRRHDPAWRTSTVAVVFVGLGMAWAGWFEGYTTAPVTVGGAVVALGALAAVALRARGRDGDLVAPLFARIAAAGASAGTPPQDGEGPDRYLGRLAQAHPRAARDIEQFRTHYLRARFGGAAVDADELARLRRAAQRIAENLDRS